VPLDHSLHRNRRRQAALAGERPQGRDRLGQLFATKAHPHRAVLRAMGHVRQLRHVGTDERRPVPQIGAEVVELERCDGHAGVAQQRHRRPEAEDRRALALHPCVDGLVQRGNDAGRHHRRVGAAAHEGSHRAQTPKGPPQSIADADRVLAAVLVDPVRRVAGER
jgi:hypothetical protein